MKAVVNGKIVLKNGVLENKVIVFDKKIIDICEIQKKTMYVRGL